MAKNIANINIDKNIDKKSTQNIDKSAKKSGPLFFLSAHLSTLFINILNTWYFYVYF